MENIFHINYEIPILYLAIHNGHQLRESLKQIIGLPDTDRIREEDPYTEKFINDKKNYIIQYTSRFEYDINRIKENSVYKNPDDCWSLNIYPTQNISENEIALSLKKYDDFYHNIQNCIEDFLKRFDKLFIWDVHSYNHRRNGINADFDKNEENPDIILGTNRYAFMPEKWKTLINKLENNLNTFNFSQKFPNRADIDLPFDVRQNVKFPGGNLSKFINSKYGDRVCCTAIEFKKIWMNEWTQETDELCFKELKTAFDSCEPLILDEIRRI